MLVFISDILMTPEKQKTINIKGMLPMSLGIINGKMWNMSLDTIVTLPGSTRAWGSDNIFGMIFYIPDNQFYLRKLDAFYNCSQSALYRNHLRDINHRVELDVTPIDPKSLDELSRHMYNLNKPVKCWAWVGNQSNKLVRNRVKRDNNRVNPGCNVEAVKKAFQLLQ